MTRQKPDPHDAPPAHLRDDGLRLWTRITADFSISDAAGLRLLALACEACDRGAEARATLAGSGLTYLDRFGQPRQHPASTIVRDAASTELAALRALGVVGAPE